MHSMKIKFKIFWKIKCEIDDILSENKNIQIELIIDKINKHLSIYNDKSMIYKFSFKEEGYVHKLLMRERVNYSFKDLYKEDYDVRYLIRKLKIESL